MDDFYAVLGLQDRRGDPSLTLGELRKAYHRALLLHHPDKSEAFSDGDCEDTQNAASGHISIDQITAAFETLSEPRMRAEYDRKLTQEARGNQIRYYSGLDLVDLDELHFNETDHIWTRACRCGHQQGFLITEADLESAASEGELVIGCRGCSLWLKVLFQTSIDEMEENEEQMQSTLQ